MAAGDHAKGLLLDAQIKVLDMFTEGSPNFKEFRHPVPALERILARQTATAQDVQVGTRNIGTRVSWLKSGVDSVFHNGTALPAGLTCDVTGGTRLEIDDKTYNDNLFIFSKLAVKDTDLAQKNLWQAGEITDGPGFSTFLATLLLKGMNDCRKKFNERVFTFLNASKQPNLDTLAATNNVNGTGAWSVNADLATIQAPLAAVRGDNSEDSLVTFDTILQNNDFITGEYDLYSGYTNFRARHDVAPFKALNDNTGPSAQATFDAFPIVFDIRSMDQLLTGRNTFAVDRNSYVITNRRLHSTDPTQFDATKWQMSIADPILRMPDGSPLYYNVIYQEKCVERNGDGSLATDYQIEMRINGIIDLAPVGALGQTGVMKLLSI